MLVCGKTECFKTVTHTLHLDTAADVQCLHLGETFKLHFCVETVAVCVLLSPFFFTSVKSVTVKGTNSNQTKQSIEYAQ